MDIVHHLKRRWIFIGLAVIVAGLGLVFAFRAPPVPVEMTHIQRGDLAVTVAGEGKTRVKEIYTVSAPILGRLRRIDLSVGDRVVAGETVVAAIEPSPPILYDVRTQAQIRAQLEEAQANQALAKANLQKAESELDFAEAEFERAENLDVGRTITKRDLQDFERKVKAARAEVIVARAAMRVADYQVEEARAALIGPDEDSGKASECCIRLRAPVSGAVLSIPDKSERIVTSGSELMKLGDVADIEIVVDLLSTQAVRVERGDAVLISRWGGEGGLNGVVRRVDPAGFTEISALGIEEQRVNVIVDLTDPPERYASLGHGFRVEVDVIVDSAEDVTIAPLNALFRDDGEWALYKVIDGRARQSLVSIGRRGDRRVEITQGVSEGDVIIKHPGDKLSDGARVTKR